MKIATVLLAKAAPVSSFNEIETFAELSALIETSLVVIVVAMIFAASGTLILASEEA